MTIPYIFCLNYVAVSDNNTVSGLLPLFVSMFSRSFCYSNDHNWLDSVGVLVYSTCMLTVDIEREGFV